MDPDRAQVMGEPRAGSRWLIWLFGGIATVVAGVLILSWGRGRLRPVAIPPEIRQSILDALNGPDAGRLDPDVPRGRFGPVLNAAGVDAAGVDAEGTADLWVVAYDAQVVLRREPQMGIAVVERRGGQWAATLRLSPTLVTLGFPDLANPELFVFGGRLAADDVVRTVHYIWPHDPPEGHTAQVRNGVWLLVHGAAPDVWIDTGSGWTLGAEIHPRDAQGRDVPGFRLYGR